MTEPIKEYLNQPNSIARTEYLINLKKNNGSLPISLTEDILFLNIPDAEKVQLIEVTNSTNKVALEDFLLSGIEVWNQDIATHALVKWVKETDHLLWYRLLKQTKSKLVSQRVQYTILDQCSPFSGHKLIEIFQEKNEIPELSSAFHSLILTRSIQWNMENKGLHKLAESILEELSYSPWPENKAIPSAICWLARFKPSSLKFLIEKKTVPDHWVDIINFYITGDEYAKQQLNKLDKTLNKTDSKIETFSKHWLPLWQRHTLSSDQIRKAIELYLNENNSSNFSMNSWTFFAGCKSTAIEEAIISCKDDKVFTLATKLLDGLIQFPHSNSFLNSIKERLIASKDPADFLDSICLRLRIELTKDQNEKNIFSQVEKEQEIAIKNIANLNPIAFKDYPTDKNDKTKSSDLADFKDRKAYFNHIFRDLKENKKIDENYWNILLNNQIKFDSKTIKKQTELARKSPRLFQLCHIETLGKFKGIDEAILKLLDYSRSHESSEITLVIDSLAKIGTPRALQELVSYITRPNIDLNLQLKICNALSNHDLSSLQREIRSTINDLNLKKEHTTKSKDLIEAISELLAPEVISNTESTKKTQNNAPIDLDKALQIKIPNYEELSSEVRRALRTAEFFHNQIESVGSANVIDLSPVIDMQYKALELAFRESFEEPSLNSIKEGIIQRKLDVIGYARPIPKAMDEFEKFVGNLPIIDSIPYFSKFKLRKMLRAICQYRPGRRFTLDGIKAFSLFFLCFGRAECPYGLKNMIDLGFKSDLELAEFCKKLHIFQDFRNRAAHEGFHPEAHNDIDGIWRSTGEIIETLFTIRSSFTSQSKVNSGHYGASASEPVIERKHSKQAS